MKKTWIEPRIEVQKFVPNEYCTVCQGGWRVACDWEAADAVEQRMPNTDKSIVADNNYVGGQFHKGGNCNHAENQFLIDSNNDGIIDGMVELNSQQDNGTLPCTLYTNDQYDNVLEDFGSIVEGVRVYWTSKALNGKTWHHQGNAQAYTVNASS